MKQSTTLTPQDTLRYQELQHQAVADVLGFRAKARKATEMFTPDMRHITNSVDTRNSPIYSLFVDWENELAPDVESLLTKSHAKTLQNTLAKQLNIPSRIAQARAEQLVEERRVELLERFIDVYQYGARGKSYAAAWELFGRPIENIATIKARFVEYTLYQTVAHEQKITIFNPHASLIKRWRLARKERREIKLYKKQQIKRLASIRQAQYTLKVSGSGIIDKIITLNLDTVLALDANRQYKKRLDALKPASRTPARRLSTFTTTTKTIRDTYTRSLTGTDTLADLQRALRVLDEVLVELFDMTDSTRNALMVQLKQYRELEREASKIVAEQATYN